MFAIRKLLTNYNLKFKGMKKVFLALGLIAFMMTGVLSINTVMASDTDNVVYDDPPKADKKSSKSCADYTKSSCCSSKSADLGSKECSDKEATKSAKATTTTTTTTTTASTKKSSPDKK